MELLKKYGLVLLLLVIGVVITEFWPIMGDEVYTAAEIAKLKRSAEEASAVMKRFEETDRKQSSATTFPSVASLCGALSEESLPTGDWKNIYRGAPDIAPLYACMSSMLDIGNEGPLGLPTNIAYSGYGAELNVPNEAKFVVNIHNPSDKKFAKEKLLQVAKVLFQEFRWDFPQEVEAAIGAYRPIRIEAPYGTVSFKIDRNNYDVLILSVKSKKWKEWKPKP